MTPAIATDAQTPKPEDDSRSPIVKFTRVWLVAEKISVSLSILLVICTIGYLSVHALA